MANILNCRGTFHRFESSRRAEAAAFASRNLKVQYIDGLLESTKLENVKGGNIVKCVEKKYFSYDR